MLECKFNTFSFYISDLKKIRQPKYISRMILLFFFHHRSENKEKQHEINFFIHTGKLMQVISNEVCPEVGGLF